MRIDEDQIFATIKSAALDLATEVVATIVFFIAQLIFGFGGGSNEGKWK